MQITWTTAAIVQSLSFRRPPEGQEVLLCYLPLSCFRAQLFHVWVAIAVAGTLYFTQPEEVLKVSAPPTARSWPMSGCLWPHGRSQSLTAHPLGNDGPMSSCLEQKGWSHPCPTHSGMLDQ